MELWYLILFDSQFNPIRELPLLNGRLGTSLLGTREGYIHVPFGVVVEPYNFVGLYNRPLDSQDVTNFRDMDFPVYSGQVIEVEQLETTQRVVVIPIKDMLFKWYDTASEFFMNYGRKPTDRIDLQYLGLVGWLEEWLTGFVYQFDGASFSIEVTEGSIETSTDSPYTYRAKSLGSVLRDIQFLTNTTIRLDITRNKTLRCTYHQWKDLRNHVYFLSNISLEMIQDIKSVKESYNTLIALGAGQQDTRDYYVIRNTTDNPESMYLYDLRQDISHDDLIIEAHKMFEQLQSNYSITFRLTSNQYNYLTDFRLGDTVTFVSDLDNKVTHVDKITTIDIIISNGTVSSTSEITIGSGAINLSEKLNNALEQEIA